MFYNIPAYLSGVKGSFTGLVDQIKGVDNYSDTLVQLMEKYNVVTSSGLNASNAASKLADASGDTLNNLSLISFISFLQRAGMLLWTVSFLMVSRAQLRRRTMRYFISTTFWD